MRPSRPVFRHPPIQTGIVVVELVQNLAVRLLRLADQGRAGRSASFMSPGLSVKLPLRKEKDAP